MRVRLLGEDGWPQHGFEESAPVTGDSLVAPVWWKQPLATLRGMPVRLDFTLRHARLFAFDLK